MFSLKHRLEQLLTSSVKLCFPHRKNIEQKALANFKVSHCTQNSKSEFHYTTNIAELIWKYSLEESKKAGYLEQHDYFGIASAKGKNIH